MSEAVNGERPLEGRVALVTGASSGLGRATTIALAQAGADVALVARSEEELESAKEEVSQTSRRALTLPTDLANEDEAAGAVERAVEAFGRIDVVVNTAGTYMPGTVEELDVEGWDRTLSVNLRAPFLLSKAAFPSMREAGGGTIVNVSSVARKKGWASASATAPPSSASRASPKRWPTKGRSMASGRSCCILVEYIEAWPLTETQKIAKKLLPRDRTDNEVDLEG